MLYAYLRTYRGRICLQIKVIRRNHFPNDWLESFSSVQYLLRSRIMHGDVDVNGMAMDDFFKGVS